jgi:Asp-tRNA(Asn)/Glu-tRNA(Gln) amidotransferase A subunit family amidase
MHEDTRVIMAVASMFTGADYLQAQRVRTRQIAHWLRAFQHCDYIVSPALACVAPAIPKGAEVSGEWPQSVGSGRLGI